MRCGDSGASPSMARRLYTPRVGGEGRRHRHRHRRHAPRSDSVGINAPACLGWTEASDPIVRRYVRLSLLAVLAMTASTAVAAPRLVRDINSERVIASSRPREF